MNDETRAAVRETCRGIYAIMDRYSDCNEGLTHDHYMVLHDAVKYLAESSKRPADEPEPEQLDDITKILDVLKPVQTDDITKMLDVLKAEFNDETVTGRMVTVLRHLHREVEALKHAESI